MYTVKTLQSEGVDGPQVSIDYNMEKQATSINPEDPIETVDPASVEPQSATYQTGDGSCVSLLASIGDGPAQSTSASLITYGNVSYVIGASNSNVMHSDTVINDDSTFVPFENITYNTQLQNVVDSDGTGAQKFMLIPLSQAPCDVDNGDSNVELQTAVATIRNQVDNDSQESISITGTDPVTLHQVHTGASGAIHIVADPSTCTGTQAIDVGNYKHLYGSESSEKVSKSGQERRASAYHVQKFTPSELVGIGKSEKEILTDYLEKTKGRRGRPKRDFGHDSSQSFTDLVLNDKEIGGDDASEHTVESKCDSATDRHIDSVYPYSNDKCIEDGTRSCTDDSLHEENSAKGEVVPLDSNVVKSASTETNTNTNGFEEIVGTIIGNKYEKSEETDVTEKSETVGKNEKVVDKDDKKETLNIRKSSRKRKASGRLFQEAKFVKKIRQKSEAKPKQKSDKKLRKMSDMKVTNKLATDTENKAEEEDGEVGSDAEGRLNLDFYKHKQAVYKDKFVVTLAPITLKTMKSKELVIEVEISDDLKVSDFSKSDPTSGTSTYTLSVVKPAVIASKTRRMTDTEEMSDTKHTTKEKCKGDIQNKRSVKMRSRKRKRKRVLVSNSEGGLDGSLETAASDRKTETRGKCHLNKDETHDNNVSDNPEDTDNIEKEHIEQMVATEQYKVDPLSVITASLGFQSNMDNNPVLTEVQCGVIDTLFKDHIEEGNTEESLKTKGKPGQKNLKVMKSYTTRITEDGIKVYGCPICGHTSRYSQNILTHISEHSDVKNFVCEECGLRWKSKNRLSKHMIVHKKDRPFTCPLCPQTFKSRPILKQHIKRHLGVKRYICEYCSKAFVTKGDLSKHIRSHTGSMPYQCEVCEKRFNDVSALYRHIRDRHMVDKPYMCSVCQKKYGRRDAIFRHIKNSHMDVIRFTDNERVALWVIDLKAAAGECL